MVNTSTRHTLRWLSRIGYKVRDKDHDEVRAMFVREAKQWGLSPERLEEMIREDYSHSRRGTNPHARAGLEVN